MSNQRAILPASRSSLGRILRRALTITAFGLVSCIPNAEKNAEEAKGSKDSPHKMLGEGHQVAVAVGDEVLFAGSDYHRGGAGYDGRVDILKTTNKKWRVDTLSVPRNYIKAAVVGTKAYLIGGMERSAGGSFVSSSSIEIYDASTGTWSADSLGTARGDAGVTAVGSNLVIAGGYSTSAGFLTSIEIIDTVNGQRASNSLSVARAGLDAAVIGNKAYLPGGMISTNGADPIRFSNVMDVLDLSTNTVSSITMPRRRGYSSAFAVGGKIFVLAGWNESGSLSTGDVYDPSTGTWSTIALPAHGSTRGAVIGSLILLAGGTDQPSLVSLIDTNALALSDAGSLSYARYNHGVAASGDDVYIGGGVTNGPVQTVEVYDSKRNKLSVLMEK